MATTSLWRVHGWLGKVVVYAQNPDKTDNPKCFEKPQMTEQQAQGLADVIEYAVNMQKTAEQTHDETSPVMRQFVS
ncbi:MAG: relaxase/mobilization nuclease, partial [Oscillospiraceae bacterium]|nr:relaxase/mobilization nuclease [Oscillospiraceae bacterium]